MFLLNFLADNNVSVASFLVVMILIIVASWYVYSQVLSRDIHKNLFLGSLGVLLVVVIVVIQSLHVASFEGEKFDRGAWQDNFSKELALVAFDPSEDLANTPYYDYENPVIAKEADEIAKKARSAGEAVSMVLQKVYADVEYDSYESDVSCFEGTAPEILQSGNGQCDTQSIVVISMLRRMGIPAKPVGGCVVVNSDACMFQSVFLQSFQDAGLAPKLLELDLAESDGVFSRSQATPSGSGGLHAWVVAWLPEDGWVHLEATNGKRVNHKCYSYHVELFPENDKKSDICVSKDFNYAQACRLGDVDLLDAHGLGLAEEVVVR